MALCSSVAAVGRDVSGRLPGRTRVRRRSLRPDACPAEVSGPDAGPAQVSGPDAGPAQVSGPDAPGQTRQRDVSGGTCPGSRGMRTGATVAVEGNAGPSPL
ncbi:hypothetical protein Shyhy02_22160 [Streptomyces hygroscopicus subsp. hygroscopicus]|nr:hypothetical protein Shyhy02_22160 [Streptomyces hygroscopicus subsp. hygroscopicus]